MGDGIWNYKIQLYNLNAYFTLILFSHIILIFLQVKRLSEFEQTKKIIVVINFSQYSSTKRINFSNDIIKQISNHLTK